MKYVFLFSKLNIYDTIGVFKTFKKLLLLLGVILSGVLI